MKYLITFAIHDQTPFTPCELIRFRVSFDLLDISFTSEGGNWFLVQTYEITIQLLPYLSKEISRRRSSQIFLKRLRIGYIRVLFDNEFSTIQKRKSIGLFFCSNWKKLREILESSTWLFLIERKVIKLNKCSRWKWELQHRALFLLIFYTYNQICLKMI
jgi:hypothetical protein